MVRETRHLWVGNLPDNIREDRIREHFKRYGRVQSVKLLPRGHPSGQHHSHHGGGHHGHKDEESGGGGGMCATVAFMDIKSAAKAHDAEHTLEDRSLTTEYYEPPAPPSHLPPIHVHERAEDVLRGGGGGGPSGGGGGGVGSVVGPAGGPVGGGSVGAVGGGSAGPGASSGLYAPRSPRFPHGSPYGS
ncbi:msx2-interacting protein-like [Ischnura elegans]|uniref:msx2-interacting protein-like n=1 Tax=Ischnura elegans TaxID=197161 RepID=UPI001ED87A0A|nr:msx2-interacting protein-like [Ischnura elegans]